MRVSVPWNLLAIACCYSSYSQGLSELQTKLATLALGLKSQPEGDDGVDDHQMNGQGQSGAVPIADGWATTNPTSASPAIPGGGWGGQTTTGAASAWGGGTTGGGGGGWGGATGGGGWAGSPSGQGGWNV